MRITEEMVDHAAALARLRLSPEERERMTGELGQILEYMDALSALDVQGVEPMSHVFPLKNVLRPDTAAPSMDRGALLENAPEHDQEAFLVPRAVE